MAAAWDAMEPGAGRKPPSPGARRSPTWNQIAYHFAEADVNAKSLITLIAQTLRDAGFLVATAKDESTGDQAAAPRGDDHLPTVHLSFVTATNEKFADEISFCGMLSLRQPADLRRIKQQMVVTTLTGATIGLVNKKDLRESVRQGTQSVVRYLTVMRRKAGPAS